MPAQSLRLVRAMVEAPALDAFRSALAPVEQLRGEQSQLETWVRESFATLESLHDELSEWQRELAREQEEFDKRSSTAADAAVEQLQDRLASSQDALRQLEEENAEQLHAIAELDRQVVVIQAELRATAKHLAEASAALDAERQRALDEQRLWAGELRELRRALERQGELLASLGASPALVPGGTDEPDLDESAAEGEGDASSRAAEIRRRAATRRLQRRTA